MMLLNVIRRHMIRSCRRSFDIAAIMIFMYSLWFYMVSGPQNMLQHEVLVARETNSHRRHKPDHMAPGQPISENLLFESDEADTNPQEIVEENFEEDNEKASDVDIVGNPILPTNISDDQKLLNYISVNLRVLLKADEATNRLVVTMVNSGTESIEADHWYIVLCHLQHTISFRRHSPLANGRFELNQVDGNVFTLTPTSKFGVFHTGERLEFALGSVQTASDYFANWYVTAPGLQPRVIAATAQDTFLLDYSKMVDKNFTPLKRYTANLGVTKQRLDDKLVHVIPTPANITYKQGKQVTHTIGQWSEWAIMHTSEVTFEAHYLSRKLGGLPFTFDQKKKFIQLTTGKVKLPHKVTPEVHQEAYRIFYRPSEQFITIVGVSPIGVFHGVQTLLSIVNQRGMLVTDLPPFYIVDFPRVAYRGLMLDVARSFVGKKEVLRTLEVMAMYKLNVLHLHLSDDQGWRLEIPGLEELTSVGGRRLDDMAERDGLHPYLGAGPHGNTHGSGYYTVQDYKEILTYATQRHIKVIPEIDTPGHSHAAIVGMLARTRRLKLEGDATNQSMIYALKDPGDSSRYEAVNGFKETTINPCMESTFTFIEHVVSAVKKMHQDIQPLHAFHLGGDEVPKEALIRSPICAEFKKQHENLRNTGDLKQYFMIRASQILEKHNLTMQIWEDGIYHMDVDKAFGMSNSSINNIQAQIWKRGNRQRIIDLVHQGYKIILSEASNLYFDHMNEPHIEERGFHWAVPYISTKTTFSYTGMGQLKGSRSKYLKNIIGIEGALWGETIQTKAHYHSMLYPRLIALAERAWHTAPWETLEDPKAECDVDWNYFSNRVTEKEMYRLEQIGVEYYIPPPGVYIKANKAFLNTALPGLAVDMSVNEGATWKTVYNGTMIPNGRLYFATRSVGGDRLSRPTRIMHAPATKLTAH